MNWLKGFLSRKVEKKGEAVNPITSKKPENVTEMPKPQSRTTRYIPGQKEPEEYATYIAGIVAYYKEAQPFSFPIVVVGFDDETMIERVLAEKEKLGLKGEIEESKIFDQRNPVLKIIYPSVFLSPAREEEIVKDARVLRRIGATDISAVGISMDVAEQLRRVFGEKSCPFLIVVRRWSM